jgi:hypothetical protein
VVGVGGSWVRSAGRFWAKAGVDGDRSEANKTSATLETADLNVPVVIAMLSLPFLP